MIKHFHQDFLLECPFREVQLRRFCITALDTPWMDVANMSSLGEAPCIFDSIHTVTRRISVSLLDRTIDAEEDWQAFVEMARTVDCLIIENDRPVSANAIVRTFDDCTMQAYLCRLLQAGVDCRYIVSKAA